MSIETDVKQLAWYQQIDLGNGIVTPGNRDMAWDRYKLPTRIDGLNVLDVGAWDGYFSFEAERRGAASVTAIDVWNLPCDNGTVTVHDKSFKYAHALLKSKVIQVPMSVYAVSVNRLGTFDLVIFSQVFYHLKNPLLALERLSPLCKNMMLLETVLDAESIDHPAMVFYPGTELGGDATNWWGPNRACVLAMLKLIGFNTVTETWCCPDRASFIATRQ